MAQTTEIVWDKYQNITFRDIPLRFRKRCIDFLLDYYFKPDYLFEAIELQNEELINERFIQRSTHILGNECSLMAIDTTKNKIIAVALIMWMQPEWRSWIGHHISIDGGTLWNVDKLRDDLLEASALKNPDVYNTLHIFDFYIIDEYRSDDEFVNRFFWCIVQTGRHMHMSRVSMMAMRYREQVVLEEHRFTEMAHIIYSMYLIGEDRPFAPFRDIDEMYAILYERKLRRLLPYHRMAGYALEKKRRLMYRPKVTKISDEECQRMEAFIKPRAIPVYTKKVIETIVDSDEHKSTESMDLWQLDQ